MIANLGDEKSKPLNLKDGNLDPNGKEKKNER